MNRQVHHGTRLLNRHRSWLSWLVKMLPGLKRARSNFVVSGLRRNLTLEEPSVPLCNWKESGSSLSIINHFIYFAESINLCVSTRFPAQYFNIVSWCIGENEAIDSRSPYQCYQRTLQERFRNQSWKSAGRLIIVDRCWS